MFFIERNLCEYLNLGVSGACDGRYRKNIENIQKPHYYYYCTISERGSDNSETCAYKCSLKISDFPFNYIIYDNNKKVCYNTVKYAMKKDNVS